MDVTLTAGRNGEAGENNVFFMYNLMYYTGAMSMHHLAEESVASS